MKSSIFFLMTLFAFATIVRGSFDVPDLPARGGMISAQFDNSLYLFGGRDDSPMYYSDLYKLTLTDSTYEWETLPQKNTPDGTAYGQGYITSDNKSMVVMGGEVYSRQFTTLNLQIYTYNFASQTWTANASNNAAVNNNDKSILFNRKYFSATYDSKTQNTYVFGGYRLGAKLPFDSYVLDSNFKATTLNSPNVGHNGRYGHTASLTSDRKIVVLGGIVSSDLGNDTFASMKTAWVFTVASNTWAATNLTATSDNVYPKSRAHHTAVINSDDQIILFSGVNDTNLDRKNYLQDIAILDTKTWTWTIPSVSGTPPAGRSYASGGILDGKDITIAFGDSPSGYCNDINVYSLSDNSWVQSSGSSSNRNGRSSKGLIAGVTVGSIVLLLLF